MRNELRIEIRQALRSEQIPAISKARKKALRWIGSEVKDLRLHIHGLSAVKDAAQIAPVYEDMRKRLHSARLAVKVALLMRDITGEAFASEWAAAQKLDECVSSLKTIQIYAESKGVDLENTFPFSGYVDADDASERAYAKGVSQSFAVADSAAEQAYGKTRCEFRRGSDGDFKLVMEKSVGDMLAWDNDGQHFDDLDDDGKFAWECRAHCEDYVDAHGDSSVLCEHLMDAWRSLMPGGAVGVYKHKPKPTRKRKSVESYPIGVAFVENGKVVKRTTLGIADSATEQDDEFSQAVRDGEIKAYTKFSIARHPSGEEVVDNQTTYYTGKSSFDGVAEFDYHASRGIKNYTRRGIHTAIENVAKSVAADGAKIGVVRINADNLFVVVRKVIATIHPKNSDRLKENFGKFHIGMTITKDASEQEYPLNSRNNSHIINPNLYDSAAEQDDDIDKVLGWVDDDNLLKARIALLEKNDRANIERISALEGEVADLKHRVADLENGDE